MQLWVACAIHRTRATEDVVTLTIFVWALCSGMLTVVLGWRLGLDMRFSWFGFMASAAFFVFLRVVVVSFFER